jgi:hypothetical protein
VQCNVEPLHPQYESYTERKNTYPADVQLENDGPASFRVRQIRERETYTFNARHAAHNGFFRDGATLVCFHCGVKIDQIKSRRDLAIEHVAQNPSCLYMKRIRGPDFVASVKNLVRIFNAVKTSNKQ